MDIVTAHDIAAPLLHAYIIVAVVLCEVPDYVMWGLHAWPRSSIYASIVFALLNIVRDSSYADIWSARGDYGPVIEEVVIASRVRGQL